MKNTPFILLIALLAGGLVALGESEPRQGFFWGGGLGAAYLDQEYDHPDAIDETETRFYMEGFVGYAVNPHVSLGLELGGWLITPDSDTYQWNPYWPPDNHPSENPQGEGIERIMAFTRLYPYRDRGGFVKLAGGYANHWYKYSGGRYNLEGWTSTVGVGWDFHLNTHWTLTPTLSYSYGEASYETHQAVTLSFGFMWHQWRGPDRFGTKPAGAHWDYEGSYHTATDSDLRNDFRGY